MHVALTISSRAPSPDQALDAAPAPPAAFSDRYGRTIRDLRLSITDRCNFRCTYCLDPGASFAPRASLLSADELIRTTRLCVANGVRRVRITGGEPTLHPRLHHIIRSIAALGIDDLSMTTNGSRADPAYFASLRDAGLDRVTFSLDSLRPDRFAAITRSATPLDTVIASIEAARDSGLNPIRVNAVLIRGTNDDEILHMAAFARDRAVEFRMIEFMPLDSGHRWDRSLVVPAGEVRERIESAFPLREIPARRSSSTSMKFAFRDGAPGGIGLIAPVTRPFCGECSRLRITADGMVRPCLFSRTEWDIRTPLRNGYSDDQITGVIRDAVQRKQPSHGIGGVRFEQPARSMSAIGG